MPDTPTPSQKVPQSVAKSTHAQSVLNDNALSQQEQEDRLQRIKDASDTHNNTTKSTKGKIVGRAVNSVMSHKTDSNLTAKEELLQLLDSLTPNHSSIRPTHKTRESYYNTRSSDMHSFYRELTDQPDTVKKHFDDLEYQDANPLYMGPATSGTDPDGYWAKFASQYDKSNLYNCYLYGIDYRNPDGSIPTIYGTMKWPGAFSGVSENEFTMRRKRVIDGEDSVTEFVRYMETNVINDMYALGKQVRRIYNLADIKAGETALVLALNLSNESDIFHFYKRDPDYLWSHKPGIMPPELLDGNRNPFLGNYNDPDIIQVAAQPNYIPVAMFAYY